MGTIEASSIADTKRSAVSVTDTLPPEQREVPLPSPKRFRTVAVLAGAVITVGVLVAAILLLKADNKGPADQDSTPVAAQPSRENNKVPGAGSDKLPPASSAEKLPENLEPPPAKAAKGELAQHGVQLLKTHCYRCHGIDFKVPRFNVLDRTGLLAQRGKEDPPYVTAGKPLASAIWQRVAIDKDMPPGRNKLSDAEKEVLRQWIVAGAPFPGRPKRPFKSEADVLYVVRDHLQKTPKDDRRFQRYFSLTHLYNNHQHVSGDDLRLYRAALAKVLNSLTWKPAIVVPRAIHAEETLFNVDLRDLGWDEHKLWSEIVKVYPYGLSRANNADRALRELARDVSDFAGTGLPVLRADWFVATATRPPLYHLLLDLPQDAGTLERQLKVDVSRDFLRNKLARAGFQTSGVSRQNRLVDRHDATHGAYWKSYDFKTNEGHGNLLRFPLGPVFDDHPFPRQAFQHDGGEIIFSLPNGLQGYLLVDGKDRRIDTGPIEVVRDSQETSGSPAIVNGLSCMACHKHGVIRFEDKVREGSAVAGEALAKVQDLYRSKEAMDKELDRDEARFVRALEEATGPFLKVGDDRNKNIRVPEPIGAIARLYLKDLGVEEVALELGIEDAQKLQDLIKGNQRLRQQGLGPLLGGGAVSRTAWSSLEFTTSPFHNVSRELGLGTPLLSDF